MLDVSAIISALNEQAAIFYKGVAAKEDYQLFMKRTLYKLLHECNRSDLPEKAHVPFLECLYLLYQLESRNADILAADVAQVSTEANARRIGVKSTSVEFGASEKDKLEASQAGLYASMQKETDEIWKKLVHSLRKFPRCSSERVNSLYGID